MTVLEAIRAVMADLTVLPATDQAPAKVGGFTYRGIDSVINAVGPLLRKHQLVVAPVAVEHDFEVVQTSGGTTMGHVLVTVTWRWFGPEERDTLDCVTLGQAFDAGDKAGAKAMSVSYRTMLLQTLALPTGEPDPEQATDNQRAASGDKRKPTPAMVKRFWALATQMGYDNNDPDSRAALHMAIGQIIGQQVTSTKDLTLDQMKLVTESMQAHYDKQTRGAS